MADETRERSTTSAGLWPEAVLSDLASDNSWLYFMKGTGSDRDKRLALGVLAEWIGGHSGTITIQDQNGHKVEIDAEEFKMSQTSATNTVTITKDSVLLNTNAGSVTVSGGSMTISGQGKTVSVDNDEIKISQTGATNNVTITKDSVLLNTNAGSVTVSGGSVTVAGGGKTVSVSNDSVSVTEGEYSATVAKDYVKVTHGNDSATVNPSSVEVTDGANTTYVYSNKVQSNRLVVEYAGTYSGTFSGNNLSISELVPTPASELVPTLVGVSSAMVVTNGVATSPKLFLDLEPAVGYEIVVDYQDDSLKTLEVFSGLSSSATSVCYQAPNTVRRYVYKATGWACMY